MTHKFQLPTGVEAEVKELTGKEQRIITQQKDGALDRLNEVMSNCTVRVGDVIIADLSEEERKNFFLSMLIADRKMLLIMIRQYTYDFDPTFTFIYKYRNSVSNRDEELVKELDISGGFPVHTMKEFDSSILEGKSFKDLKNLQGDRLDRFRNELKSISASTYADVLAKSTMTFTLPKSGINIRMRMCDGYGEVVATNTKKQARSINTLILMRMPTYLPKSGDGKTWINVKDDTLDKLPASDVEYIKKVIQIFEPRVDTEFRIEKPDGDESTPGAYIISDILQQFAFFFPSETT